VEERHLFRRDSKTTKKNNLLYEKCMMSSLVEQGTFCVSCSLFPLYIKKKLMNMKRLVKGTGEIIEEIVSKSQQQVINKTATEMDGKIYANTLYKQH
jgi:hypothetical protein